MDLLPSKDQVPCPENSINIFNHISYCNPKYFWSAESAIWLC